LEFFEVVRARQSIRLFTSEPVEEEKLEAILDAAVNRAPSAGNMQSYRVYVVTRLSDRQALRKVARDREYMTSAPVVLVFCTDTGHSAERYRERAARYSIQDAAIAATFAMLAATALGLASVPVGAYDDDGVWKVLGEPEGIVPVLMLPIGYPAERPERRPRRPVSDLVHHLGT
jgi:nitroreductase